MNKRDAINEILLNVNELPLDVSDNVEDIQVAITIDKQIDIARKKVLSEGWYFNEITTTLYPNTENYIPVPDTFLSVDGTDTEGTITVRDWKLFNKETLTFKFTDGVQCDVIEDVVFDDIPYSVANYIVQLASLQAYVAIIGKTDDLTVLRENVMMAKVNAYRDDARKTDGNILLSEDSSALLDRTSK